VLGVLNRPQLDRRLHDLDALLEALEQTNLEHRLSVPMSVTMRLHELGLVDHDRMSAAELIPTILELQRQVRRHLALTRRKGSA
jgi:hypothetical protein